MKCRNFIEEFYCYNYNSSVQVSQQVFFDCGVSFYGNNFLEISWKYDNKDLNYFLVYKNKIYILVRLLLVVFEEDDGNVYIC